MIASNTASTAECLAAAGLPGDEVRSWLQEEPGETTDFTADRQKFSDYWARSTRLLGRLPAKPRRSEREQAAAGLLQDTARTARGQFLCLPHATPS